MVTPSSARANLDGMSGMIPFFILIASWAVARMIARLDGKTSMPSAIGLVTAVVAFATRAVVDGSARVTSDTASASGPARLPAAL